MSALVLLAAGVLPGTLAAQVEARGRDGSDSLRVSSLAGPEGCDLVESAYVQSTVSATGERVTNMSGPVRFSCDDGTTIRADSVVQFAGRGVRELIGGVVIDGPETRVAADRVESSDRTGRTEAVGSVIVEEKASATRLVGDSALFVEAGGDRVRSPEGGVRPGGDRADPSAPAGGALTMWGERPYATLRLGGGAEADPGSAGESADTVVADRLHSSGEGRFGAAGRVEIVRSDLLAFADSLDYERDSGRAVLRGRGAEPARVDGEAYDLTGDTIELEMEDGEPSGVVAIGSGRLLGEDVEVESPAIQVFLREGEMERLVATDVPGERRTAMPDEPGTPADTAGTARTPPATADPEIVAARTAGGEPIARAVAADFVLAGDSIEVEAPGQILERVVAVGRGRAESLGRDSLNRSDTPDLIRKDWIEGDTVIAHFVPDTADTGDSAEAENSAEAHAAAPDVAAEADAAASNVAEEAESTGVEDAQEGFRLERLVAIGSARSLYRLPPEDVEREQEGDGDVRDAGADAPDLEAEGGSMEPRPPAVHYVVGDRITILLRDGAVERMEVAGQTQGIYLEPTGARPPASTPPDGG